MIGIKRLLLLVVCLLPLMCYAQLPAELKKTMADSHQSMGLSKPATMFLSKCQKLDTCLLKLTYNVTFVNDTSRREKIRKDIGILEIGKKTSHYYSYLLYQADSLATVMKAKGTKNFPSFKKYVIPEEIYVYNNKKEIESIYRSPYSLPCYRYVEAIPDVNWNLSDESKSVLGYRCQKATCVFRGRTYTAWYSIDIPLKSGPYKFFGLPGLILLISDANNEYCWECIGITKGNNEMTINKYVSDTKKVMTVDRNKIRTELRRFCQDPARYLALSKIGGSFYYNGKDYSIVPGDLPPEPFNPIEKK